MNVIKFLSGFRVIMVVIFITSCGPNKEEKIKKLKGEVINQYAEIVFHNYKDAHQLALSLQDSINKFTNNPSAKMLAHTKQAWVKAREPYGQTEAFRFYGGPIDDQDGPEPLINAWPLDESYVDYVRNAPNAGIINNVSEFPEINEELLVEKNEEGGETNVSTGYHAIEFLLWGQDFYSDSPGKRSYTDYVPENGDEINHALRRQKYLNIIADLLVRHLASLKEAWAPGQKDNYRQQFLQMEKNDAIKKILTGIGTLSKGEMAGERLYTAYDNQSQEDEHSCFSDNTHRDMINNQLGIQNVYLGRYKTLEGELIEGPGLDDLVKMIDEKSGGELGQMLEKSMQQLKNIHVPFDQAIIQEEYRPAVLEAVNDLRRQGDQIAGVAAKMDIRINTAIP